MGVGVGARLHIRTPNLYLDEREKSEMERKGRLCPTTQTCGHTRNDDGPFGSWLGEAPVNGTEFGVKPRPHVKSEAASTFKLMAVVHGVGLSDWSNEIFKLLSRRCLNV